MSLLELFCSVDDFCMAFESEWVQTQVKAGVIQRRRPQQLCLSECMTILIAFQTSGYRNFKTFYQRYVCVHWRREFPHLLSYGRFVELMPRTAIPLMVYLNTCLGACTGISFVDSTTIAVCRNQRISHHRVFAGLAGRGRSSMGWFFGFKLHLVINEYGELLTYQLTPGNVDDRTPVPTFAKRLFGRLFADRGYLGKKLVAQLLHDFHLHLVTFAKTNMRQKGPLLRSEDAHMLYKRTILETINDQLKNDLLLEHTRHRSPTNFIVNLLCALIAYCHKPHKPAIATRQTPLLSSIP